MFLLRNGCGPSDCRFHKSYGTRFDADGSLISLVEAVCPHVFISEQVLRFATPYDKGSAWSLEDEFSERLVSIKRADGTVHSRAQLDSASGDPNRPVVKTNPRIQIVLCDTVTTATRHRVAFWIFDCTHMLLFGLFINPPPCFWPRGPDRSAG